MKFFIFTHPNRTQNNSVRNLYLFLKKSQFTVEITTETQDLCTVSEQDIVVVAGGDGTLHQTINHISFPFPKICILPIGSGNDFVRNFTPQPWQNILHSQNYNSVDVWLANQVLFLNAGGFAFDARVAFAAQKNYLFWGSAKYMIAVLRHLFFYKPILLEMENDEMKKQKVLVFLGSFGNGKFAGGNFCLFPRSHTHDFLIDILLIPKVNIIQKLKYTFYVKKGKHLNLNFIKYKQLKNCRFNFSSVQEIELDGELYHFESLNIQKHSSALNIQVLQQNSYPIS